MRFNALNYPRLPNALRRLFAMVAQPSVGSIAEEVQCIVRPFEQPDFWALMEQMPFYAHAASAALAGNYSGVGIRNPTGSGNLVMIEGFAADAGAGLSSAWQRRAAANAASVVASSSTYGRDSRQQNAFGGGCPVLIQTHQTANIGGAGFIGSVFTQYPQRVVVPLPVILAPGSEFALFYTAVNTAIGVAFYGWARPASGSELTLA